MKVILALSLSLSSIVGTAALAQDLSAEQRAKLSALPPALRAEALAEFEKFKSTQGQSSQPLERPQVVIPRPIQPSDSEAFDTSNADAPDTEIGTPQTREIGVADLAPFGYDLFSGSPTTFAPVTEIPVPVDYIVGPGDQIRIQFFGKESNAYDLYVSRGGLLQVPDLGPIAVAGQRFSELKQEIGQRVAERMIGMQVFVTLGELRSIRVFILGDVNRPGSYTVSSLSTMTNALFVSGGIKTIGSLRSIQLKRLGEVVNELDLYDLLLRGDTSEDVRLQPGDVIFVPPVGRLAGIAGEVRRPAIYELQDGESTIGDLVSMSGGLASSAFAPLSQLERVADSGLKEIDDIDLSQSEPNEIELKDGDLLRIFSNINRADNVVTLEGHAERPGVYEWTENMRISDLIQTYDSLLPTTDLQYALAVSRNLQNGRISIRSFSLEKVLADGASPHNLNLRKHDRILVFQVAVGDENDGRALLDDVIDTLENQATSEQPERIVRIRGHVRYPGRYPLEENMKFKDLVRAAGGYSQDAYTLEAELIRYEDNQKRSRETQLNPLILESNSSSAAMNLSMRPFDEIFVKRIPDWSDRETITLSGELMFPGVYVIEQGETLSRVIRRAGGLTDLANMEAARFFRETLRQSEALQIARLKDRLQEGISTPILQGDSMAMESVETARTLIEQLESTEARGRLVINLSELIENTTEGNDVVIYGGDLLEIPRKPQSVTIIGSVNYPTSHLYDPSLDRDDYINRSGGLLRRADKRKIYIVRANGRVESQARSRFFPNKSQLIFAGDTIVVPLDVDSMKPLPFWGEVSQTIYQLALGAAAVKSF